MYDSIFDMYEKATGMAKKDAISFRLGARYREKLEELAEYRNESQAQVMRAMIDVTYKAMLKRKEERRAAREARMAQALNPNA